MKKLLIAGLFLMGLVSFARAQLVVTNFSITDSSLTLTFSGTLTGSPSSFTDRLQIWAVDSNVDWVKVTNGNPTLSVNTVHIGGLTTNSEQAISITGNDFVRIVFGSSLVTGATASGTITASFPANTFDIAALQATSLAVYWGADASVHPNSGALQTTLTSAVPEPSTYAALIGITALGLVAWRRRTVRA